MLDETKKIHRPTRLQGYDYSSPGYYFVTFNTKVRAENILCSIENVGPAPLGGPAIQGGKPFQNGPPKAAGPTGQETRGVGPTLKGEPIVRLTQAGEILRDLIENIHCVYLNADVDSYVIMPDHVHLLLYFAQTNDTKEVGPAALGGPAIQGGKTFQDGPPRGAGPTQRKACLPQVINALKSLASKKAGFSLWQRGYHDHIIRNDADLYATRQYIRDNPTKWIQDKD